MRLRIIPLVGPPKMLSVEAHPDTLVKQIKDKVCSLLNVPSDRVHLASQGKVLDDLQSLLEQEAEEEETYYLFPTAEGG